MEGFKTGGKQEKRETANRIQKRGIRDWRDSRMEGYRKRGKQERRV